MQPRLPSAKRTGNRLPISFRRPSALIVLSLIVSAGSLPAVEVGLPSETNTTEPYALNDLFPNLAPLSDADLKPAIDLVIAGKFDEAKAATDAYLVDHPNSAPAHEVLGMTLAFQGNLQAGLNELQTAVRLNPEQSTAYTKMGDILLRLQRVPEAQTAFTTAIKLNPFDRLAHQRLGLMAEERGEFDTAIEHLRQGLRGAPSDYLGVKLNLAALYVRTRQFKAALDLLAPFLTADATPPLRVLVLAGTASLANSQPTEGMALFERATQSYPDNAESWYAQAIALRQNGSLLESAQGFKKALSLRPEWAEAEFQWAETLAATGDFDAAFKRYDAAAAHGAKFAAWMRKAEIHLGRNDPDEALALYRELRAEGSKAWLLYDRLAGVLQGKGEFTESATVLQEAVDEFPGSALPLLRLSMNYAAVRDYVQAESILAKARQMEPQNPQILKTASLLAMRQGHIDQAIADANALLDVVPKSVGDQFYLGTLYEQQGNPAKATELYQRVLASAPDHVGALNNLAILTFAGNDKAYALTLAKRAWENAPESAQVLDTYGWMLAQSDQPEPARELLAKSVQLDPQSPAVKYHFAVVLHASGETDAAAAQLRDALAQPGDFTGRADALKLAAILGIAP